MPLLPQLAAVLHLLPQVHVPVLPLQHCEEGDSAAEGLSWRIRVQRGVTRYAVQEVSGLHHLPPPAAWDLSFIMFNTKACVYNIMDFLQSPVSPSPCPQCRQITASLSGVRHLSPVTTRV